MESFCLGEPTLSLDVDERYFRSSIGWRGENVLRLNKEHGVFIRHSDVGGKVYILGKKERAEASKDAIIAIVMSKERKKVIDVDAWV